MESLVALVDLLRVMTGSVIAVGVLVLGTQVGLGIWRRVTEDVKGGPGPVGGVNPFESDWVAEYLHPEQRQTWMQLRQDFSYEGARDIMLGIRTYDQVWDTERAPLMRQRERELFG